MNSPLQNGSKLNHAYLPHRHCACLHGNMPHATMRKQQDVTLVLILTCVALLDLPNLAASSVSEQGLVEKLFYCGYSFKNSKDCLVNLMQAYKKLDVNVVTPECCKTLENIDRDCIPEILKSVNPLYSRWVQERCARREDTIIVTATAPTSDVSFQGQIRL
ncbi:hypothetical protein RJ639_029619 [Escallonia herrerae]|uniref:Prolamin-like domain-containing protein n=1 Tax=Escallonia herrerae TaxID=1293975 RepID=A0AA88XGB7_9ASTE|nr:hypothetical protein RJ639_029619 [Escallonia herrerae]